MQLQKFGPRKNEVSAMLLLDVATWEIDGMDEDGRENPVRACTSRHASPFV